MTRGVYHLIVRMHPSAFRQRFGDQMMSVFDEAAGEYGFSLILDGLISLARQWLLRMGAWKVFIAVLCASIQLLGFGYTMKGLKYPAESGQVLTPTVEQLIFFALALTCSLFVVIMFLILWNTRFQRRRSADYKTYHRTVRSADLLKARR